jgi:ATP:corrinoid adenosyltransferase
MSINFSRLTASSNKRPIEPRDIFMSLPSKDNCYGYPRDVQTEVWKQWYLKRNEKNVIIKMNTGSGKTVVGLTILQSCLNEGKGPAVYIVPDNYLVQQVCSEAKKLGIRVAFDDNENKIKGEDDYFFKTDKAILVANIHKLVNGKSIFGLRSSNNVQIGSIVIDDVHACLDTIKEQHTILIESNNNLYEEIIDIFSKHEEVKENQSFYEITKRQTKPSSYLIPFWIWQKESRNILNKILDTKYSEEAFVKFNLPLMQDNWETVNCVVSSRGIEFTLKGSPINKIKSFEKAQRRIFMSATLSDDGVFVSAMGLKENDFSNIITPEKANDIGERLIIFPKYLNSQITDEEILNTISEAAKKYSVVVIVPSFDRVSFWEKANPNQILSSKEKNIESGVARLKNGEFIGLTILVNKYDGIDLPDDACRLLVIDGLPIMKSEYDLIIQGMIPNDKRLCRAQIQKIEQGMGRGVRSNNDYCAVVLMGDKLANSIFNQHGDEFFSSATYEQLNFSKQVWEDFMKTTEKPKIDEIFSLFKYILDRDPEWISTSKSVLSNIVYDKFGNVDSFVVAMRNAFERECLGRPEEAFSIMEKEKNMTTDEETKGLLMQYMAEYKNFTNPAMAQELLISARNFNSMVLKPIKGTTFSKLNCAQNGQAAHVMQYMIENKLFGNNIIIKANSILDDLKFSDEPSNRFEQALKDIASFIGINSSRPEEEFGGKAPDNLLALGNLEYAIIECKNRTITEAISKDDCGQLLQSVQWFKNHYLDDGIKYYPIMIHNSSTFSSDASPSENICIMTPEILIAFCESIRKFAIGLDENGVAENPKEIESLLNCLHLKGNQIVKAYTQKFSKKKS